jgi:hypothetical protein
MSRSLSEAGRSCVDAADASHRRARMAEAEEREPGRQSTNRSPPQRPSGVTTLVLFRFDPKFALVNLSDLLDAPCDSMTCMNLLDNDNWRKENDPAFFSASIRTRHPKHSGSNCASGRRNEGEIGDSFGWGFSVVSHPFTGGRWVCVSSLGVRHGRTAPHSGLPPSSSHYEPFPLVSCGWGRSAQ